MLLLTATNHSLELETSSAVSTDYQVSFVDLGSGTCPAVTPGSNQGNVASATTTSIAAAPGSSTTRQIKLVTVRNRSSSASNTVTLKKDVGGTEYHLFGAVTLQAGETLTYEDGLGFRVFDATGNVKLSNYIAQSPSVVMVPHFATANLTSTKTITTTNTFAIYVGKAPRSLASVQLRYRVTTAAATITWAEVALAKGAVVVGGNPILTVVGFTSVSGVINSTGQKTTTVSVSSGQALNAGDDLWLLIGNQATTAGVLRAQSIADDLQVGLQASGVMRPSLNVGSGFTFTLEGAATVAAWMAGIIA